jgi:hypothetical protein
MKNKTVAVYEDPITKQKFEGEARLVKFLSDHGWWEDVQYQRWQVEFLNEPGNIYERVVENP